MPIVNGHQVMKEDWVCRYCLNYREVGLQEASKDRTGECLFQPPTVVIAANGEIDIVRPIVFDKDRCFVGFCPTDF